MGTLPEIDAGFVHSPAVDFVRQVRPLGEWQRCFEIMLLDRNGFDNRYGSRPIEGSKLSVSADEAPLAPAVCFPRAGTSY
jgi:hypothetical protein